MKVNLNYYKKIFNDMDRDMDRDKPPCLILLQGSEYYIMEEMAARIIDLTVPQDLRSFNLTVSYGTEIDIDSFITTASSYPFVSGNRLLVLKEMEKIRGGLGKLLAYCRNPVASSILVFLRNTHDETGRTLKPPRDFKKLESIIKEKGRIIAFEKLTDDDLVNWVRRKAKKMNITMDNDVTRSLIGSVGENLYDIQNELDKLHLVFEDKRLAKDDLKHVLGRYRLNVLFDLIGCIEPGKPSDALRLLLYINNTGAERTSVVLYHLIRHFLALLKIKAGYRTGGFRYSGLKRKAGLFSVQEILLWLENLRITELLIKSTSFPDDVLLESALVHSMQGKSMHDFPETFHAA
jgi:DNA polymerase III delta subunit